MKRCMAYRSFIDACIIAEAGSDFPPGPFAPLMVLSDDPHAVPLDKIKDIRVLRTVTGDVTVFEA